MIAVTNGLLWCAQMLQRHGKRGNKVSCETVVEFQHATGVPSMTESSMQGPQIFGGFALLKDGRDKHRGSLEKTAQAMNERGVCELHGNIDRVSLGLTLRYELR